ncbi:MAG: hypothetical protein JO159_11260 [Acidobacteria bacterium]|nr:hypothetical protein [Acidobacteriota bacterium]MBV9626161.1 hypothetical protein [Acidobacteriota bacterium]
MNRRRFLAQAAGMMPVAAFLTAQSNEPELHVKLDPSRTIATIPADFIGLGYEISSVARQGLLSAQNTSYVQLVRTLGKRGVIRVGGNTSDYASYSAAGPAVSSPKGSVINQAVLDNLGTFLHATGWRLIWGLNLGSGTQENAIEEAKAVQAAVRDHLLAFEIGNEPDLFSRPGGHRQYGYDYEAYLREYRAWRDALQKAIPGIPLAGPDAAVATDWVVRFAREEGQHIKLLTHHYYREGQNPSSSIQKLLATDPKLYPTLAKLSRASQVSGVPYRICEMNSYSGGGKPGVSDTFAAALWVLDFMFAVAAENCAGVNLETGVNQLGFISSYSPIGDEHGHYRPTPEYYGMLAFAQSAVGRVIDSSIGPGTGNIKVYASQAGDDRIIVTVINKEPSSNVKLVVDAGAFPVRSGCIARLSGPSLESKSGVSLGGAEVSSAGSWKPARTEPIGAAPRELRIRVPAASAVMLTLRS